VNAVVVFDMDGTLIDSVGDIAAAINRMRASYGLSALTRDAVVGMVGSGARVLVAKATADTPGLDQDEAFRRYRHEYDTHLVDSTTLYPGVPEGLQSLRSAGFRLAVYTNKPHGSTLHILKQLRAEDLFSAVIGADSGFPLKPAPDALQYILRETDSDPGRSWMVGDNWTDVESGHAAGLRTAFCSWGYGVFHDVRPDVEAESFPDLIRTITGANK
jgi:phosphoglycolate phosphatase